jgi:hypothetical protein
MTLGYRSLFRYGKLLLSTGAVSLMACGSNGLSAGEETQEEQQALVTCTSFGTFHLLNQAVPATPAGELLGPDPTQASGFSPTHVITPNGFIWYTDSLTGSFNNGFWSLNLWTNHPGGFSPVFAQLGVSQPDGSGFSPIAVSSTIDVNATGTGNHVSTLSIHVLAPISLSNQRLIAKVFLQSGSGTTAPTMAYNGGVDFDTNLQTTGGCATPTVTSPVSFHLVGTAEPGVTPAGNHMRRTNTAATGFFPTRVLTPNGFIWYTEPINGSLHNGFYSLNLWTNHPGGFSPVFAQVGVSNADGSAFSPIAVSSTLDVNATGTGNHVTTLSIHVLAPITLSSQRFVAKVFLQSGSGTTAPTMVFNGGSDFDSRLDVP